jgi:hypothetical protein
MQVVKATTGKFGPVVYCHWSGDQAPKIVERLRKRMADRMGDLDYWSARLVQETIGDSKGSTSFGIWNADAILEADDSHGDAGVVVIDCDTGYVVCAGGYLTPKDFGMDVIEEGSFS